jgi:hypothetical protein
MDDIEIKAIRSLEELQRLNNDYESFLSACSGDTFYLRSGWIKSMIDAWALGHNRGHGSKTLFLLLAFRGTKIIGAMPLQLHEKRKGPLMLNRLYGLGVDVGSGLSCPAFEIKIARGESADSCFNSFQTFINGMRAGIWDVLDLDRIPENSLTLRILDQRWPSQVRDSGDLNGVGIEIPYGQTFDKLQYGNGKFRSELRRRHRKLIADHGKCEIRIDSEITAGDWDQMGQLHSKRQEFKRNRGVNRDSIFENPLDKSAMFNAMKFAEKEGMAIYYRLNIDQRLAAFQIGVKDSETLYLLTMGFDPEFSHYAPFKQLMVGILEDACRRGVTFVNCLPGLSYMKRQFSNSISQNERRLFVHPSLQAHLRYRTWSWCRDLNRRVRKKLE